MRPRIPLRQPTIDEWQRLVADAVNALIGEMAGKLVTVTANYTVADDVSDIINNKSGSGMVLTLPSASRFPRRELNVKTLQAQTVASAASNVAPIDSASLGTAILPGTAGAWSRLKSNGTAWVVMARGT